MAEDKVENKESGYGQNKQSTEEGPLFSYRTDDIHTGGVEGTWVRISHSKYWEEWFSALPVRKKIAMDDYQIYKIDDNNVAINKQLPHFRLGIRITKQENSFSVYNNVQTDETLHPQVRTDALVETLRKVGEYVELERWHLLQESEFVSLDNTGEHERENRNNIKELLAHLTITPAVIMQAFDKAYKEYGFHVVSRRLEGVTEHNCIAKLLAFFSDKTGEKNQKSLKFLVLKNLVDMQVFSDAEASLCVDTAIEALYSRLAQPSMSSSDTLTVPTSISEETPALRNGASNPSLQEVQDALHYAFNQYRGIRLFFNKPSYLKDLKPDNYLQVVLTFLNGDGGVDKKSLKYLFVSKLTRHEVASNEEAKELITQTRDYIANIVQEFENGEEQKGNLEDHFNTL